MENNVNDNIAKVTDPIIKRNNLRFSKYDQEVVTPIWVQAIFKLYGYFQIFSAVSSIIVPMVGGVLLGVLAAALGGGRDSFFEAFKLYGYLVVGVIPAAVLAYGFLRNRKWIITCLGLQLASSLFFYVTGIIGGKSYQNELLSTSFFSSMMILFMAIPVIVIVIAIIYRNTLSGKFFAITPVLLMVLSMAGAQYYTNDTVKNNSNQNMQTEVNTDRFDTKTSSGLNSTSTTSTTTAVMGKNVDKKSGVIKGIKINPKVDNSILDSEDISMLKYTIENEPIGKTREACVDYATQYFQKGSSPEAKAEGVALVNACVYYMEGGK
jgi:hypothetical protein